MKYLLFAGECYYAKGGAHEVEGSGDDIESLKAEGRRLILDKYEGLDWWHIMAMGYRRYRSSIGD